MAAEKPRQPFLVALLVVGCLGLIWLLKVPGLLLAGMLVTIALVALRREPDSTGAEHRALVNSVRLSAEDIRDVLAAYDRFLSGADAEALADRTLYRPALTDPDCDDPDVERFFYLCHGARRYLSRLEARLADPALSVRDLERLLTVTDERAVSFEQAWLTARRAARRLGPGGQYGPHNRAS